MGVITGIKIRNHYTGESGGGKSSVDQVFGICKEELKRRVTLGMGTLDISDAVSLAKALNHRRIKKTVNYAVTFLRVNVKEPLMNKSARDAKLQSHSARTFLYDEEGLPTYVQIEEQSYLTDTSLSKLISITGIWPNTQSPHEDVIPKAMLLDIAPDSVHATVQSAKILEATST